MDVSNAPQKSPVAGSPTAATAPAPAAAADHSFLWSGSEFSFGDVLDVINPLEHLPIVGDIYRAITGHHMGHLSALLGDTLYGGVVGAATSVANIATEEITGKDITENVLSLLGLDGSSGSNPGNVADAGGGNAAARPQLVGLTRAAADPEDRRGDPNDGIEAGSVLMSSVFHPTLANAGGGGGTSAGGASSGTDPSLGLPPQLSTIPLATLVANARAALAQSEGSSGSLGPSVAQAGSAVAAELSGAPAPPTTAQNAPSISQASLGQPNVGQAASAGTAPTSSTQGGPASGTPPSAASPAQAASPAVSAIGSPPSGTANAPTGASPGPSTPLGASAAGSPAASTDPAGSASSAAAPALAPRPLSSSQGGSVRTVNGQILSNHMVPLSVPNGLLGGSSRAVPGTSSPVFQSSPAPSGAPASTGAPIDISQRMTDALDRYAKMKAAGTLQTGTSVDGTH